MDGINVTTPSVKLDALSLKAREILSQLQQAGLFRAIVINKQGNSVLLDTAYGNLTGKAPNNLNKGDEILARLLPGKSEPTIKIEQHAVKILTLKNQNLNKQLSANFTSTIAAKVLSHKGQSTQLLISQNTVNIPRQNSLLSGETLLLIPSKNQQVELLRIQPGSILKNALSTLLPKTLKNTQNNNLTTLQKFANELLQSKPDQLLNRITRATVNNTGGIPKENIDIKTQAQGIESKTFANLTKFSNTDLKQLLTSLASPLARMEGFKPSTVQHVLTLLSLIKPTATPSATAGQTLPATLGALVSELKNTPESFKDLIQQVFQQSQDNHQKPVVERALLDISHQLRNELIQQADQTLNQLLTQKTSVRLQTEQNLPIHINLNIPLQVHNESRNLKLKIKQKQKHEDQSEQHWEINLSFEFGLLGLISTHILLQNSKISAHFWATHQKTKTLIDNNLHQFKSQLQKSGFELGLFDCFQGQPPESSSSDQPVLNENLLDVKA